MKVYLVLGFQESVMKIFDSEKKALQYIADLEDETVRKGCLVVWKEVE